MFGLQQKDWEILNKLCLEPLKRKGATLWVFGSRARGDHRLYSDIDLLYEAPSPLSLSELSLLKEQLEESRLSIKVDLVDVNELSDSFRDKVITERIKI